MKIKLKKNNKPKQPGTYLGKRCKNGAVKLWKVAKEHGVLIAESGEVSLAVEHVPSDSAWSDAIEIVTA